MSGARPGERNLITDVAGIAVGQATDETARTGVTVILPNERAVAAVDVRGGAPGTRETDALATARLVQAVDAIVLSGGSVFGLAAADGVTAALAAKGRGYRLAPGAPPAPVVPAAILFDLANGGDKDWGEATPYRELGRRALDAARTDFQLGAAGAGAGAMAGALKGGTGSASVVLEGGWTVGAITAVNSYGSVVVPGGRTFWAAPFEVEAEFGGVPRSEPRAGADDWGLAKPRARAGENTTIACVAVDAALDRAQLERIALMAQDGLARAIRPCHAPFDGDVVFGLATGRRSIAVAEAEWLVARLGAAAADCLARAVARAVYYARAWPGSGVRAWCDLSDPGR
ncbi:MAG TPA: P1 family peptidase [Caulobacteraceae bacterium]|nr:P1 family peptidase [Caulobacteraceae bacterium]